jgi:ABC-2 type transport system permease protein
MRTVLAVAQRELRSYFLSPLAYLVIAFFLFGAGLLFGLILDSSREATLRPLLSNVSVLFLFVVPMISMRLLAEEQRTGSIEVLLTNPVHEWEIVTGKFVAAVVLILVTVALTLVYPAFLYIFGNPDTGPMVAGYVGIILQAAAFMAIGLWVSSLTENQIVAAVLSFIILLVLWLSDTLGTSIGGVVGTIISYVSMTNHLQDFPNGVINTKDVLFYLTVIAGGLVLSTLSLQSRRYR